MTLRHERRRRMLAEDSLGADSDAASEPQFRLVAESARPTDAYSAAARFDRQRRVFDLLPTRPAAVAFIVVVALLLVAAAALLHVASGSLAHVLDPREVNALQLDSHRSLGHWVASMLLALCCLVSVLIYSLRRHRVDDYYGRYRVWLWAALGCLLASIAEATDLALLARGPCRMLAERLSLVEAVVWYTACAAVMAGAGIRVWFEIRGCRLAAVALVGSAGGFMLSAAVQNGWLVEAADGTRPLAQRGSWLIGYVLILAALLMYARYVVLEVDGRVASVPSKRKRSKPKPAADESPEIPKAEPAKKPTLQLRTDLDAVESRQANGPAAHAQAGQAASRPVTSLTGSPKAGGDAENRHLSRAERKRMRREARMAG